MLYFIEYQAIYSYIRTWYIYCYAHIFRGGFIFANRQRESGAIREFQQHAKNILPIPMPNATCVRNTIVVRYNNNIIAY